jgi:hypothetical protein
MIMKTHFDGQEDGFAHGQETELEGAFGLGQGFGLGIDEQGVDGLGDFRRPIGVGDADDEKARLAGPARTALLHGFVEIGPLEIQHGLVGVRSAPGIDPPDGQRPVAGKKGAAQGDGVAHAPVEAFGQFAADDGALAVRDKGLALGRCDLNLRVEAEKAVRFHRQVGEKVFLVLVDAAEPVAGDDHIRPGCPADAFLVGIGQGLGQGHGVSGHQPVGRRGRGAGIPGVEHRAHEAEGEQSHGHAHNGQDRAQTVPEGVFENQLKEQHAVHPFRMCAPDVRPRRPAGRGSP